MRPTFPAIARALCLLAAIWATAAPVPSPAQTVRSIAAIVNEDVITDYDLRARLALALAVSNLPDSEETRRRLLPQVLRTLIDERLEMQEAKRLNITVTDKEVAEAVATIERQNNLPAGSLDDSLAQRGVPFSTLVDQVKASIAWGKIVRRQIRPRVEVGEEEVDEFLADLRARGGRTVFDAAEIFIAADSPEERQQAMQVAERVTQQARAGASFAGLAQQFSQSASAADGGELGRVQEGQLDPRLEAALAAMQPGEISDPVPVENGVYVLKLNGRQRVGAGPAAAPAQAADTTVALRRILLPVPPGAPADEVQRQAAAARRLSETVSGCAAMEDAARTAGSPVPVDVGQLRLSELPEAVRQTVATLPIGRPSQPLRLGDGFTVLMVCERTGGTAPAATAASAETDAALPSRDEVLQRIGAQRIEMMARRYLRDLRRAAFVDIRA